MQDGNVAVYTFLSTPSARRATRLLVLSKLRRIFLSTPSARRATGNQCVFYVDGQISIHALREEGDPHCRKKGGRQYHFYPRPPRGGRRFSECFLLR